MFDVCYEQNKNWSDWDRTFVMRVNACRDSQSSATVRAFNAFEHTIKSGYVIVYDWVLNTIFKVDKKEN